MTSTDFFLVLIFSSTVVLIPYQKIFNVDDIPNENNKYHNLKWLFIPDHPYRMLIIGGYGSGKGNALLNIIKEEDIDSLID